VSVTEEVKRILSLTNEDRVVKGNDRCYSKEVLKAELQNTGRCELKSNSREV
jgi:hypothetical protein